MLRDVCKADLPDHPYLLTARYAFKLAFWDAVCGQ